MIEICPVLFTAIRKRAKGPVEVTARCLRCGEMQNDKYDHPDITIEDTKRLWRERFKKTIPVGYSKMAVVCLSELPVDEKNAQILENPDSPHDSGRAGFGIRD